MQANVTQANWWRWLRFAGIALLIIALIVALCFSIAVLVFVLIGLGIIPYA